MFRPTIDRARRRTLSDRLGTLIRPCALVGALIIGTLATSANAFAASPAYEPRSVSSSHQLAEPPSSGQIASSLRAADELVLPVPFRSQLDGTVWARSNCGPTSIAMVLAAFGENVPTQALRDRANQLLGVADPAGGTRLQDLALVVQEHRLSVSGLAAGNQTRRWTLDELREQIRLGHPVVIQVYYPLLPNHRSRPVDTDHFVPVIGVKGIDFVFNDSADQGEAGQQVEISAAELTKAWGASDVPFGAFAVGPGNIGASLLPPTPVPPTETPTATPTVIPTATPTATPTERPAAALDLSPAPSVVPALLGPSQDALLNAPPLTKTTTEESLADDRPVASTPVEQSGAVERPIESSRGLDDRSSRGDEVSQIDEAQTVCVAAPALIATGTSSPTPKMPTTSTPEALTAAGVDSAPLAPVTGTAAGVDRPGGFRDWLAQALARAARLIGVGV